MNHELSFHSEDSIEMNYLIFEQKAKEMSVEYDYSELDKLLQGKNWLNCLFCGKPSMAIKKEKNLYYCFSCSKTGKLSELDIVKKTPKNNSLVLYNEIYNELKSNYKIKTKEYALIGINFYKLNSTFISSNLYEDEDVMFELIKNHAFDTCGDKYIDLKIFKNEDFQKRILVLDEENILYIDYNNTGIEDEDSLF